MPNTYNFPPDKSLKPRTDNSSVEFVSRAGQQVDVYGDLADKPAPFISTWRTTTATETVTLPANNTSNNFDIDWGDGDTELFTGTYPTHTYATAGDYTVTIGGTANNTVGTWFQNNGGDKSKLISVQQLGECQWTDLTGAFYGCTNLTSFIASPCDTSAVTDMSNMMSTWSSMTTPPDLTGY